MNLNLSNINFSNSFSEPIPEMLVNCALIPSEFNNVSSYCLDVATTVFKNDTISSLVLVALAIVLIGISKWVLIDYVYIAESIQTSNDNVIAVGFMVQEWSAVLLFGYLYYSIVISHGALFPNLKILMNILIVIYVFIKIIIPLIMYFIEKKIKQ